MEEDLSEQTLANIRKSESDIKSGRVKTLAEVELALQTWQKRYHKLAEEKDKMNKAVEKVHREVKELKAMLTILEGLQ